MYTRTRHVRRGDEKEIGFLAKLRDITAHKQTGDRNSKWANWFPRLFSNDLVGNYDFDKWSHWSFTIGLNYVKNNSINIVIGN